MWVVGIEPGSFGRTFRALNHRDISLVLVRVFDHNDRTEANTGRFTTELMAKGVNLRILEYLVLDTCSAPLLSMPNSSLDTSILDNHSICGPYLTLTPSSGAWGCFSVSLHQSYLISLIFSSWE